MCGDARRMETCHVIILRAPDVEYEASSFNPSAVAVLLAMFGISPNIPRDPVKEGRTYQK